MKKIVRNISLFFKSLSIQYETRRLKKEIKNAYSDKPYSFQWKRAVLIVLTLFLFVVTFISIKKVQKRSDEKAAPFVFTQNQTVRDVAPFKDSAATAGDTSAQGSVVEGSGMLQSDGETGSGEGVAHARKSVDSNIIKKQYPLSIRQDSSMKYLLIADKGDKIIHLFQRRNEGWFLTRTFPVASGAKSGKKMVRGDLRTPEGIYFIEGRKEGDSLNEIYGPLAYVLNYPNRHDSAAGRTGNGIWIHGTTPGEVPVDTKGCLELHNDNLIKLSNILGKGDLVPVVIHSDEGAPFDEVVDLDKVWEERDYILDSRRKEIEEAARLDSLAKAKVALADSLAKAKVALADSLKKARAADLESLKKAVNTWTGLWETMEIDSYSRAYDTLTFKVPGYNWAKWKKKKIGTFNRYKSINIEVSRLRPRLLTDSTGVVVFRQVYQSDRFRAVDTKRLSMKKIASEWKITAEVSLP